MSNISLYQDTVSRLAAQSDAVGRLARDKGGFAAVVAAFEAKDPNAFRWVLDRLEMLPYCELICEWIQIKLCVLRCIEVCGPPRETAIPDLRQFAGAIVRLTANERLMRRAVDAVSCGDADDYRAVLAELKLEAFCHLLCRWICGMIHRRVCEIICTPHPVPLPDVLSDVRAAGKSIALVIAKESDFAAIEKAAMAFDCEILRSVVTHAGFAGECEIICGLLCTWRCTWICLRLCPRPSPVLTGAFAAEEARHFALAARPLAGHTRALGDLVAAVQNRDTAAYDAIVARFGLSAFCEQLCAWVCAVTCTEFCICVCRPPALRPFFEAIGHFDIFTDIDPVSGKTNKGLPMYAGTGLWYNGGPSFAFFGSLQLGGACPTMSPGFPGVGMKYRFLYDIGSGGLPVTADLVTTVQAGTRLVNWPSESAGIAVLPLLPLHLPVLIWGPTAAQPTLPADPVAPGLGTPYVAATPFYIAPDPVTGWVTVDPNVEGGAFIGPLLGFDTSKVTPGPNPAPGVLAGAAVPAAAQRMGTNVSLTFEATRVTTFPPGTTADYNQSPVKIHVNNYGEVNELNFLEFVTGSTGCCTPIDATLSVQFTVDHEEMDIGAWSLSITSCSASAPGDITPPPHATTLALAISASQTSLVVASSVGFPAAPFDVSLSSTGETLRVTGVSGTTWTVTRGQEGTAAAAAAAGAALSTILPATVTASLSPRGGSGTIVENTSAWDSCSYTVWLVTRPGLTTGLLDRTPLSNPLTFCICGH